MSRKGGPQTPTRPEPPRPELAWIKQRLRASLAKNKIGLLPHVVDALAGDVWAMLETDRALSVLIMLTAWEHYSPIDDDKIQHLARLIEMREDYAPGKCRIGDEEFNAVRKPRGGG